MKHGKILFVQLPVQSHDYYYNLAHLPLAVGVLAAFLNHRIPKASIAILNPLIASFGSTPFVCRSILSEEPDIIAMSCYLWNIERTLHIARKLREEGLKTIIIAGGPEIHPDNTLLHDPDCPFDVLIVGEGERALSQIVNSFILEKLDVTRKKFITSVPVSPEKIPSPYLEGFLSHPLEGTLLLESSRGCPYRCTYCHYYHNGSKIVEFPSSRIIGEIEWAINRGIKEITFVDPSFTSRPHLKEFLNLLHCVSKDKSISFSAELNAELCNDNLASLLARAGFTHAEVGLQSINPEALKAIGRPVRIESFLRGVKAMRSRGIETMVDLIVGLPYDTKEDLFRAVDFCISKNLFDELGIYPLSLLPGTILRNQAKDMGIIHDPLPPYYVIRTPWMDENDIRLAFQYAEEVTTIDYFPPEFPYTKPLPEANFTTILKLKSHDDLSSWCKTLLQNPPKGQAVSFIIEKEDWWIQRKELGRFIKELLDIDPFLLISWIIPENSLNLIPARERMRVFEVFFIPRNHYKDREKFSTSSSLKSTQVFIQIFHHEIDGTTLLWITPEFISGEKKELWFITNCEENRFPESSLFIKTCQILDIPENSPYRITFVR